MSLHHWEGEPTPPKGRTAGGAGSGGSFFLASWAYRSKKFSVSRMQEESAAWVRSAQVGRGFSFALEYTYRCVCFIHLEYIIYNILYTTMNTYI